MKYIRLLMAAGLLCALIVPPEVFSADTVHLFNRLRLGYDDNIYLEAEEHDPVDSFRVIEELELLVNLNMERMYLGLAYRPSLLWYTDRDEENSDNKEYDLLNDLDLNFMYRFSPTLSFSLSDSLRSSRLPAIADENYIVRRDDDNLYNSRHCDAVLQPAARDPPRSFRPAHPAGL